ncbi:MAG TPA: hypothetical protein VL282_13785 [Tepidisphaeraceae bacterium]|nr:hypothetical protein [Tepidisphaeraceae bacterium]
MTIGFQKSVAVLLAVIVAVSSHLCFCTGMAAAAPVIAQSKSHACCKEREKKVPEQRRDKSPCDECNSRHPVVTAQPDSISNPSITHFALTNEIPTLHAILMPRDPVRIGFAAPSPPLLLDLIHQNCQLTV